MHPRAAELGVGSGMAALGGLLGVGAVSIPSEAGYGGVGPNFLPWVVAVGLLACGALLVWRVGVVATIGIVAPRLAALAHVHLSQSGEYRLAVSAPRLLHRVSDVVAEHCACGVERGGEQHALGVLCLSRRHCLGERCGVLHGVVQ